MVNVDAFAPARVRGNALHALKPGNRVVFGEKVEAPLRSPRAGKRIAVTPDDANVWLQTAAQILFLTVVGLLVAGFLLRDKDIFVPEEGTGYALGIIGGVCMLLLLFYPLFKRITMLGFSHHSTFWLRVHMLLGTVGPLLIFYHSNFSFGATNSNVALVSMILVAGSGVVGRYIYTRVHRGMSAVKLDLNSLLANSSRLLALIGEDTGGGSAPIAKAMADFAIAAMPVRRGILANLAGAAILPVRVSFARSRMMVDVRKVVRRNGDAAGWSASERRQRRRLARMHINEFLHCAARASQFSFWERMFSMWHVFHVPLFFVLLASGVIHVVAVHLY